MNNPVKIIVERILVVYQSIRFTQACDGKCGAGRITFIGNAWPTVDVDGSFVVLHVEDTHLLKEEVGKLLETISMEEFLEGLQEVVEKQAKLAYDEEQFAYIAQRRFRSLHKFYNNLGAAVLQPRGGVTVKKFKAPELPKRS